MFLSRSPPSRSMSPFPVCADEHVTSPPPRCMQTSTTSSSTHVPFLFSSCAASSSLSLSSLCPSPSSSRDQCHSSRSQSHRARRAPVLLADDSWIAHVASADVKTRRTIGPRCTRLALPSPTVPRSGLLKNWKGFWVVYRIVRSYCVRFLPYFVLDSSALHSPFSPFDLEFILDIRRDVPHPRRLRARRRTPRDYSVNFHIFRTPTLSHTTPRGLSPAVS